MGEHMDFNYNQLFFLFICSNIPLIIWKIAIAS